MRAAIDVWHLMMLMQGSAPERWDAHSRVGSLNNSSVLFRIPCAGDDVVFKIVPMEGDTPVNGEPQKRAAEITAEVAIALTLSALHPDDGDDLARQCLQPPPMPATPDE